MFFLSLFLVLASSYLLTSILGKYDTKQNRLFLYFLLISFAQIILSFEILSLFNQIGEIQFITANIIFSIISVIFLFKHNKSLYKPNISTEIIKIIKALKRDKLLYFIGICFIIFLILEILLVYLLPVTHADALMYNFSRSTAWIQNGNLNHFVTPDTRELIMPINMELLYTWYFMFFKTEKGINIFSYGAFLFVIYIIYNFLGETGFCRRKRLWSIFVFSAFPLIGLMAYTPFIDILAGGLLLAGIYLFYVNCKNKKDVPLYFSTLAIAIAIGTKTTSIMALPSIFILFVFFTFKYKNFQAIKKYFILGFLNFMVFSSYNYILNFIDYNNPITNNQQYYVHQFRGGIKGYITNLIKYCFLFFDVSGISFSNSYNNLILQLEEKVLNLIGENLYSYTSKFFAPVFVFSSNVSLTTSFLGAIGLFIFLPSLFCSIKQGVKRNKSVITVLSFLLIINLIIYSKAMVYTMFNTRYLVTFLVISSPIIVFSYIKSNKNIYKWILIFLLFIYLIVVPHKKPVAIFLTYNLDANKNVSIFNYIEPKHEEIKIYEYLKDKKVKKIALISQYYHHLTYYITKLRFDKIIVDRPTIENINIQNLKQYDYIITTKAKISSIHLIENDLNENVTCLYKDYENNTITIQDKEKITITECIAPISYFESDNFEIVNDIQTEKYILLKNKDNN